MAAASGLEEQEERLGRGGGGAGAGGGQGGPCGWGGGGGVKRGVLGAGWWCVVYVHIPERGM